ncbi:MAG: hypothetical protein WBH71_08165 [Bacteroidales bacterium]|jgi:hypothetical protein|nr:hypothetical protein [Bacteroidales bacterium]MDI9591748.1 hypothetical protein [Bacteroidota bacterium]HOF80137.1 hypothetical protein [Bacteroidales bacterium]HOR75457.1 hypothetical protein [Bacteroidales bacterium]HPA12420.1 hypothetical protein [Bacteroidales bacterium]
MKVFRQILALIIALVFFITTSGLNFYTHICGYCQSFDVSLTDFTECCDHNESVACKISPIVSKSYCNNSGKPLCKSDYQFYKNDGCCLYKHSFFKIADSFNYSEQISLKQNILSLSIIDFSFQIPFVLPETHRVINPKYSHPPPLIAGKDRIIYIHALKLAPSFDFHTSEYFAA